MVYKLITTSIIILNTSLLCANITTQQRDSNWYKDAQKKLKKKLEYIGEIKKAKNIILFIGDGMGISTVTAARILDGQNKGSFGEENMLSFDKFPYIGLSKTYNTNSQTPDSAGTMSAIVTGVKTKKGVLSVSENSLRSDCKSSKGKNMTTILELAESYGMSTGIVSTARLTHATPAATYAHTSERGWENNSKLSPEAIENGCKDIAAQFINFSYGDGIDVAMGGGRREFMPKGAIEVEGKSGKRTDGRDLREEWKTKYPDGKYIENLSEFNSITKDTKKLFALFNDSHMHYESDRKNDLDGEPSLTQMTQKAIEILSKNKKGYFLMVEAARIDQAHHAGNAYNALSETIELSKAVDMADKLTNDKNTLIIVTADHSHVFTMAGYPKRGNPILGKVISTDKHGLPKTQYELAADGLPYTTLGYTNGRGFMNLKSQTNANAGDNMEINIGRKNLTKVDTTSSGYHQEALIPIKSETHSGEDVTIYSKGPGANLLSGVNEQNFIFHVMQYSIDLDKD
ncbi:MAG: alkaline phosphatase [Sulfurimonas sp.]|nr:MAG: alkaline phosphatase [Sulfurimonas sp.]